MQIHDGAGEKHNRPYENQLLICIEKILSRIRKQKNIVFFLLSRKDFERSL